MANKSDDPNSPLRAILITAFKTQTPPTGKTGNTFDNPAILKLAKKLKREMNKIRIYQKDETLDDTIHILSLFMEIEDTSRSKYNYTMSENDRAFALYMINEVFERIHKTTPGSFGEIGKQGSDITNASILNIIAGHKDTIPTTTGAALQRRIKFEQFVSQIEIGAISILKGLPPNDAQRIRDTKNRYIEDFKKYQAIVQEQWRVMRLDAAIYEIDTWGAPLIGAVNIP